MRTITTHDELAALPDKAVILYLTHDVAQLDAGLWHWTSDAGLWYWTSDTASSRTYDQMPLPARLLYTPEETDQ